MNDGRTMKSSGLCKGTPDCHLRCITARKAARDYECAPSCADSWKEMQTQPKCSHAHRWTFEKPANLFTTNYLQFNDAVSHMLFMVWKQYLWSEVNLPRSPRNAGMAWPGVQTEAPRQVRKDMR